MGHQRDPHVTPVSVIGPKGFPLTLADLHRDFFTHWTPRRKAEFVCAVDKGLLSKDDAARKFHISGGELALWRRQLAYLGLPGLRALYQGDYANHKRRS